MNKYVAVGFDPEEIGTLRNFLKAMNGIHIITISDEEIEDDIRFVETTKTAVINRIVLHNDGEVESFKNIMSAFFSDKEYKITDDPDDESFKKWLKEKEAR